jgi:hypothetical protein
VHGGPRISDLQIACPRRTGRFETGYEISALEISGLRRADPALLVIGNHPPSYRDMLTPSSGMFDDFVRLSLDPSGCVLIQTLLGRIPWNDSS